MGAKLLEQLQIVPAGLPADLNAAALTGDYVSLKNYRRLLVLVLFGDGTAGHDVKVSLRQAKDTADTDGKVLNCLQTGRIYSKQHANALTGVGQWTKETQAVADESWDPQDNGEQVGLLGFEILASDLDVSEGFCAVRADIADPTAAKVVAVLYILGEARDELAPELMPSAL